MSASDEFNFDNPKFAPMKAAESSEQTNDEDVNIKYFAMKKGQFTIFSLKMPIMIEKKF